MCPNRCNAEGELKGGRPYLDPGRKTAMLELTMHIDILPFESELLIKLRKRCIFLLASGFDFGKGGYSNVSKNGTDPDIFIPYSLTPQRVTGGWLEIV
jgi:hypothetical protein